MKFLIVLCVFGAAIYSVQCEMTPELIEKYHTMRDECIEKSGATLEMVHDARRNVFTDNDKLATYMRCMFEKAGFMDHDGTMHVDTMMKMAKYRMTEDEAKPIIDTCMEKMKDMSNLEKKCYELFKCFRSASGHPMQ